MTKKNILYHTENFGIVGTKLDSTYTPTSKISFCTGQPDDSLITAINICNLENTEINLNLYANNTSFDFLISTVTLQANSCKNILSQENFEFKYLDANSNYLIALPSQYSLMISTTSTLITGIDIVVLREDF